MSLQAAPISGVVSLLPTTQYEAGYLQQLLLFASSKGINKIISALYMLTVKKKKAMSICQCLRSWTGVGVLGCGTSLGGCQSLAVFLWGVDLSLNLEGE